MAINIALGALTGLGLFLYGMTIMGSGLEKATGDKLKKIIEMLTKNRLMAVLVGIFVTAVIQSSSATTVMVVGFVNAGIMKLTQAVGIIMGANVGTTVTAQLVSFNLEQYAPVAVGIGMVIYLTTSKDKTKHLAEILIGFGILFIGMTYLKDAVKPLREIQAFKDMLVNFGHNPFLGILMGFVLTVLVQSSSASIGILLALASQGLLPIASALPILYGDNIGTCTTALISSIGAGKNGKRAAIMHLTFNIIGTILFAVFLSKPIIHVVTQLDPTDVSRQIANAHTIFNFANVIIQFPFAMFLVKIAMKLVPDREGDEEVKLTKYLDSRILETPSIALGNTIKECLRMGNVAKQSLEHCMVGFFNKSKDEISLTFEKEKKINALQKAIMEYIIKLSQKAISVDNRQVLDGLFNTINDIERVGDHAENIAELTIIAIEKNLPFSTEAIEELKNMHSKVIDAYQYALEAMKTGDIDLAYKVLSMEEQVDIMEKTGRNNHIYRLNNNLCNPESGIILIDIISNMERIADHASNIARAVMDTKIKKQG